MGPLRQTVRDYQLSRTMIVFADCERCGRLLFAESEMDTAMTKYVRGGFNGIGLQRECAAMQTRLENAVRRFGQPAWRRRA